jgi:hypothetical protein
MLSIVPRISAPLISCLAGGRALLLKNAFGWPILAAFARVGLSLVPFVPLLISIFLPLKNGERRNVYRDYKNHEDEMIENGPPGTCEKMQTREFNEISLKEFVV